MLASFGAPAQILTTAAVAAGGPPPQDAIRRRRLRNGQGKAGRGLGPAALHCVDEPPNSLPEAVDAVAGEHSFSGVVSVDRGGEVEFARAYGLAHRAHQIPNTVETGFAIASGAKGLTALVVVSLIEQGVLDLSSTARSVLRDDLPLIDDG